MEKPSMEVPTASMINGKDGFHIQSQESNALNSEKNGHTPNIIDNHTFSNGLHAWLRKDITKKKVFTKVPLYKFHAIVAEFLGPSADRLWADVHGII
ncbi:hypothetical protein Tco_0084519 [Tanacetum coccineum]